MSDITDFINEVEDIKTSGRWNSLNEKIKILSAVSDNESEWITSVFSGLIYRIFKEYHRMQEAHKYTDDDLAIVAWHARNLLELGVWSIYCTKNKGNARRFYEDAGRDHHDILVKLKEWGEKTHQGSEWKKENNNGLKHFTKAAAKKNVLDLDSKYLRVSNVAKGLGLGENYEMANKMLSKFAHPTAGYVVLPIVGEGAKKLKVTFFIQGCVSFLAAFNHLEQHFQNDWQSTN